MEANGGGGGAAPTGCYKCGRPGHWSRDCPSNPNPNPIDDASNRSSASSYSFKAGAGRGGGASFPLQKKPIEKPQKAPKTRPKLTPDLLLSNDGIGFVLRHFPKAFKYRGLGHEVKDLGNLLRLYAEWHSHLIPYYSFNQFVHKVEQVGASKRVKLTLRELRERVASGGDPSMLHEPPEPHENSNHEQDAINVGEENLHQEGRSANHDTDDFQNDMLHEMYENIPEPSLPLSDKATVAETSIQKEVPNQTPQPDSNMLISEELRARIEANRLKALARAAARKHAQQFQAS